MPRGAAFSNSVRTFQLLINIGNRTNSTSAYEGAGRANTISALANSLGVALARTVLANRPLLVFLWVDFSILLIVHNFSLSSKMLSVGLNGLVPSNLTNFIALILPYFEPADEL